MIAECVTKSNSFQYTLHQSIGSPLLCMDRHKNWKLSKTEVKIIFRQIIKYNDWYNLCIRCEENISSICIGCTAHLNCSSAAPKILFCSFHIFHCLRLLGADVVARWLPVVDYKNQRIISSDFFSFYIGMHGCRQYQSIERNQIQSSLIRFAFVRSVSPSNTNTHT